MNEQNKVDVVDSKDVVLPSILLRKTGDNAESKTPAPEVFFQTAEDRGAEVE